jgi:Tfp pilus assembly protein PilN
MAMINLLPPEEKRQLRAARTNTLLARYNIVLLGAIAFLGLAIGIVYLYLSTTKAAADQVVQENATQTGQYSSVQNEAQQFRSNLSIAKQILDREIPYTTVLLNIAQTMPEGVVLESLVLDSTTFGTETTLSASARDYDRALAFKDALQNSPYFADAHFQSVNDTGSGDHPLSVSLSVTISQEISQ